MHLIHIFFSKNSSSRLRSLVALVVACLSLAVPQSGSAATTINGANYATAVTWNAAGSPYILTSNVTVATGGWLTIDSGVVVVAKGSVFRTLSVQGKLTATGALFTSVQDDAGAGGDVGGDGPTVGAPGNWTGLSVLAGGDADLQGSIVRFAGYGSADRNHGAVTVSGAGAKLSLVSSTVERSQYSGLVANNQSSSVIRGTTFTGNGSGVSAFNAGVLIDQSHLVQSTRRGIEFMYDGNWTGAPPTLTRSNVTGNGTNGVDLYVLSATPAASRPIGMLNNIHGNGSKQLYVTSAARTDQWIENYWGPSVEERVNPDKCVDSDSKVVSSLSNRGATGNPPAGPTSKGYYYYFVGSTAFYCQYDSVDTTPYRAAPIEPGALSEANAAGACLAAGHAKNLSDCLTDPVNSQTGAFSETVTDLSLPGAGVTFDANRTYSSRNAEVGVLGRGWHAPYSDRLVVLASGDVTAYSTSGQRVTYLKQSGGAFIAPEGGATASTLSKVGTTYELLTHGREKYVFDSMGRVQRIEDRNGQGLSMTWGTSGRLESIVDSAGRSIALTYDANGRVVKIAIPDGRFAAYGYTGSYLTSVTDVRGKVWTYSYTGTGLLRQMVNPRGHAQYTNTYDGEGRITSQLDAMSNSTTLAYSQVGTVRTTIATDAAGKPWRRDYQQGRLTKATDPRGAETTYAHDANSNVVSETDPRGYATVMTWDARGNMLTRTSAAPLSDAETWTYNADNTVASYVDGRGKSTTYSYDTRGNLTQVTRPLNNVTSYARNATTGLPISVTDPRGKTTTLNYDAAHNLSAVTSAAGRVTSYDYDSSGRVTAVVAPRGNETGAVPANYRTTFTLDGAGNQLTAVDALGNTTTSTYDAAGNRASTTTPKNETTTWTHNAANEVTKVVAADATETTFAHDARGLLTQVTAASGRVTTFGYDDSGRKIWRTDPRGNVAGAVPTDHRSTMSWDLAGNQTGSSDQLGNQTLRTYDAANRVSTTVDGRGKQTSFVYDDTGNLTRATDPRGAETSRVYDDLNRVTSIIDPRTKTWTSTYDAAGNLLSRATPRGGTTTHAYDDDGLRIKTVDPRGNVTGATPSDFATSMSYNADGALTSVQDPLGGTVGTGYDRAGRVVSRTDQRGKTTQMQLDANGRLQTLTAPDGATTAYTWSSVGNPLTRTDHNTRVTTWTYDQDRRLLTTKLPTGAEFKYGYDTDGNRASVETPAGTATAIAGDATISYAHDRSDRLASINYSDATPDVTYGYDAASNRASMVDGSGTTQYAYDDSGNLASVSKGTDQFAYQHDLAGNITSRTWPGGIATTYTHDNDGNIASATTQAQATTYSWDPAGRMLTRALPAPNGYTESRNYDLAGRLSKIESSQSGSGPLVTASVTRDPVGSPLRTVTSDTVETYAYDDAGRLSTECYQPLATDLAAASSLTATGCLTTASNKFLRHDYDGVGNRTQLRNNDGTTTFTHNADDKLTSRVSPGGTTSYGHDANGNRTSSGTTSMTYDLANRMVEHSDITSATQYAYDGDGKRTATTTGSNTTEALWDIQHPNAQLALERSTATGVALRRYSYGAGERTAMHTSAGAFYYHYDPLGSIAALTDAAGAAQHLYQYEGFGQQRGVTSAPGAPENPMRFASEHMDTTGLYHLRARQYDPSTGRFTAQDPLEHPVGLPYSNTYHYGFNNPLVNTDPSGMCVAGLSCPQIVRDVGNSAADIVRAPAAAAGQAYYGEGGGAYGAAAAFDAVNPAAVVRDARASGMGWGDSLNQINPGLAILNSGDACLNAGPKPRSDAAMVSRQQSCVNAGRDVLLTGLGGAGIVRGVRGGAAATGAAADAGLASRGLRPLPGTRVRPDGIPEGWRVRPSRGDGGTWYYDPTNKGNAVRVMQGDPLSPFPNSQKPYVRWQQNGQPLDASGNALPSKYSQDAHIPLSAFSFRPELFG